MDTLMRDGVPLAFEDVGKGAPPILLIHDLGGDHTTMQGELAHLRARHRVVAVDLRGHGASGGRGQTWAASDHVNDLAWLCFELGLFRPIAVGRGTGAALASALAARWPDLLTGAVTLVGDQSDRNLSAAIDALLAARSGLSPRSAPPSQTGRRAHSRRR